jgi:hypothetical protein
MKSNAKCHLLLFRIGFNKISVYLPYKEPYNAPGKLDTDD